VLYQYTGSDQTITIHNENYDIHKINRIALIVFTHPSLLKKQPAIGEEGGLFHKQRFFL
jgi:hypothetical protein